MVVDTSLNSTTRQLERNCFRQVCDKPCAHRIIHAEWSPMHDLIAVITSNGEVRLHRMYWQKVWMLPPKDSHATSLSWKHNGRLLAIGFENGDIKLLEIEKCVVVHSVNCTSSITSLCWVVKQRSSRDVVYEDCCERILPETSKEEYKNEYFKSNIADDDKFSILMAGNSSGELFLFIEGVYLILCISVNDELGFSSSSILSSHLGLETGIITFICKAKPKDTSEEKSSYYLHQCKSALLSNRGAELSHLSSKFIKMMNMFELLGRVLKQMNDASEDICVKINSKLEKLEQILPPENSVSSEFTVVFTTGKISAGLTRFLKDFLTTKGLKQIAQNIQSAYVSLRCDIGELDTVTQHLLFHLLELREMASWHDKFGILGLCLSDVQKCVTFISQFRMKTQELLDVISSDMTNFNVFFSWLKNILCQATGDVTQVTPFQLSNEDYDVMLEFLEYRLIKVEKQGGSSSYDLERVSQYFRSESIDPEGLGGTQNVWNDFLESNEMFMTSDLIMKPAVSATLQGLYEQVKVHFDFVFDSVSSCISKSLSPALSSNLYQQRDFHEEDCKSHFSFMETNNTLLLLNLPCTCESSRMYIIEVVSQEQVMNINGLQVNFTSNLEPTDMDQSQQQGKCTIRDTKFYNEEYLTILVEESESVCDHLLTLIAQVPLHKLLCFEGKTKVVPNMVNPVLESNVDIQWNLLNSHFSEVRRMEAFRGAQLYVNGYSRKVSSVVSLSGRRIRIFDMTAFDDELDDTKAEEVKTEMESTKNETFPSEQLDSLKEGEEDVDSIVEN